MTVKKPAAGIILAAVCGLTALVFTIDAIVHFAVGEGFTVVNLLNVLCAIVWIIAAIINYNRYKRG